MAKAGSVTEMYWITSSIVQSAGAPFGNCWLASVVVAIEVGVGEGGDEGEPVAVMVVVGSVADGDPLV